MSQTRDIESIYPLSPMQAGMLFHTLLDPEGGLYIEQVIYRLKGRIRADAFRKAWQQVAARHPVLRSLFVWENRKEPLQVVRKGVTLPWTVMDLRDLDEEERKGRLDAFLQEDRQKGFPLNRPPLVRFALIRMTEESHAFVWSHHHILIDGWCLPILLGEVLAWYRALIRGEEIRLPPARPYQDYIAWLRRQDPAAAEKFWKARLAGFETPTPLSEIRQPETGSRREEAVPHREEEIALGEEATGRLKDLSRSLHVTVNTFLQAGWAILLSRYSREKDVLFGAVVSGRPQDLFGAETMVGLFINTLPVRVRFSPGHTLFPLLEELHDSQAEQLSYSFTPLSKIQEAGGLRPDTPLFESILAFENYPVNPVLRDPALKEDLEFTVVDSHIREKTNYPLNLMIAPGDRLRIKVLYDETRFHPETIRRMLRRYSILLTGMGKGVDCPIRELEMLEPEEKAHLLFGLNDTGRELEEKTRVHLQVERQGVIRPDAVAVVQGDRVLTYGELNARARILARKVIEAAASPHPRVAVFMERSPEMIVAMLGILKAGGAYLPLDTAYPKERIRYILEDSRASLVLTRGPSALDLDPSPASLLSIDEVRFEPSRHPSSHRIEAETLPGDCLSDDFPAYGIYTSGSTGRPKGVLISHRGLENLIAWNERTYPLAPGDRASQAAGPAFDASVWEIWSCLTAGAALHLLSPDLYGSAEALKEWILSKGITACFLPTPLAQEMLSLTWPEGAPLKILHAGGDILQRVPPKDLPFALANQYGPTECTVIAVSGTVSGGDEKPHVGRPIHNMRAYILDPDLLPLPLGVPGELYLAGQGLGIGYIDRPELTAGSFLPNPFASEKGERLYKTGDLARYLPDGKIEILQRTDDQVKIRGFRVETGEIEGVLLEHPGIREVKVMARRLPSGARRLAAYLVSSSTQIPRRDSLVRHLAERLPDYMIPPDMVFLDRLPRNASGKIDRKALPDPDPAPARQEASDSAPQTEVEKILARIWTEVLNLERVGVHDDFFSLGGDSILSIQIMSRASRHGLRFTLQQLFQYPTIAALAPLVVSDADGKARPVQDSGPFPLTPVQHWFFEQNMPEPHHFNQAMLFKTTPDATPEILEKITRHLMEAHPSLRLRFFREGKSWRQVAAPMKDPVPFHVEDLSVLPPEERIRALEVMAADYQTRLDLEKGPLCRFVFFRLAPEHSPEGENRLLVAIHHLAVDGVSWRILIEDMQASFQQIVEGKPVSLPGEKDSFNAWAERLSAWADSDQMAQDAQYWLSDSVSGPEPLPVDFPFTPRENISGTCDRVQVALDREETDALLHRVPETYRTRIDEALLTALAQTFCRWTGEAALRVLLEGHGRESFAVDSDGNSKAGELDISHTTGWFTSLYPAVLHLENREDPGRALISVKEQLREIPRKGAGFGLLKYLCRKKEIVSALPSAPRANPWPEVTFNYLGQMSGMLSASPIAGMAAESPGPEASACTPRDHLLNISGFIVDGSLQVNWVYSRRIHHRETIEGLAEDFLRHLKALIAHCLSPEAGALTASDVPGARLDQKALESFLAGLQSED